MSPSLLADMLEQVLEDHEEELAKAIHLIVEGLRRESREQASELFDRWYDRAAYNFLRERADDKS